MTELGQSELGELSPELLQELGPAIQWIAEKRNVSQAEALRKAIATEAFFQKELEDKTKILLQRSNKEIREVTL